MRDITIIPSCIGISSITPRGAFLVAKRFGRRSAEVGIVVMRVYHVIRLDMMVMRRFAVPALT